MICFSVFSISVFLSSLLRVSEGAMAGLQCYIGNCSSMEACRRPELVTDCPHDQAYDACLSIIVQKGRLLTKWSKIFIYSNEVSLFFSQRNWQFTHKMLNQPPAPDSACIKFADRIIVNLVIVEIFPESDLQLTRHCVHWHQISAPSRLLPVSGDRRIF